jgi:hypothetical protein
MERAMRSPRVRVRNKTAPFFGVPGTFDTSARRSEVGASDFVFP